MFLFTEFNLMVVVKHTKIRFGLLYSFLDSTYTPFLLDRVPFMNIGT